MSQFLVKVFATLGLTQFNSVYFSIISSVIFTRLILGLRSLKSQEHCTDQVTGFPITKKLILIPLITFFTNFANFFGNNFLFLQRFLIRKLLLDKVILPSH